jgi:3-hydroxyacyl-CoA dehydrogenase / enoyl-CoA hydratase / 3-hydroxybutyryl-CoA epimerase
MTDPGTDTEIIRWQTDPDGILVLTMDAPGQSANTLSEQFVTALTETVVRLRDEREHITGVVLTSAKKTFFAGGDLNELVALRREDAVRFTAHLGHVKAQLRALETLGRPVVAAINGAALGGGLELALAAHHRIAADVPGCQVGFPEVGLGLLPAAGGVIRSVRYLGVTDALEKVLLSGKRYGPAEAVALGLIDEVTGSIDDLLPQAKQWIADHPDAAQPWDRPGFAIPGGTPARGPLAAQLPYLSANLRRRTAGAPAPAERAILAAAVEGAAVDIDTASLIETRYFIGLAAGQIAKNRISATFFDTQHIKSGGSRPAGVPPFESARLGVVGAGMMGAGIAYVAARAGIDVVLTDLALSAAEKGKGYSARIVAKSVAAGRSTQAEADALLARIHPTENLAGLADVDFVVEAVFENAELKTTVFGQVEQAVGAEAVLGSNTSTLPITALARAVTRPADFVGVHFFSPVDRMPLIELIKGEQTSPATLAKAFDLARQLGKTPIVVNDSRGFFTSRVIIARLAEAVTMVGEGIAPASIEQAALQSGYPAGPLQLLDELTLTLPRAVREEDRAAAEAAGQPWTPHPSDEVFDRLIDEFGRTGRAGGAGFYDYDASGRRAGLWPGMREHFPAAARPAEAVQPSAAPRPAEAQAPAAQPPLADLKERLLFAEALEAWRAHESGVIDSAADANVGSLLGIGFPAWTGGVLRYIEQYDGGPAGFARRAEELAARYGARFSPPASLADLAGNRAAA